MSGLVAVIRHDCAATSDAVLDRMLAPMHARGADRAECWREQGVALCVQRADWEFGADFSGPVTVVQDADAVVVADARLYYRDDLRRKLTAHGVRPRGQTASQLILAAFHAFGESCAEHLEGDFAFLIWDRRRRRLLASRDFTGGRPLFHAAFPGGVAVASSIGALRAHPSVSSALDVEELAVQSASLLFSSGDATVFRAVRRCPAGATIVFAESAAAPRVRRWFRIEYPAHPPVRNRADAAEELRDIVRHAIRERMAIDGTNAAAVSGGFDSPAVLALAQQVCADGNRGDLAAISVSFPTTDSAREDEMITDITTHLGASVHWVDGSRIERIPLDISTRAWAEDEPSSNAQSEMLWEIAAGARQVGARVALNGHGGDFAFQCGPYFFGDLLRFGHWRTFAREWRALALPRTAGVPKFWKYAVEPVLPRSVLSALGQLRGRAFVQPFERIVPPWMATPACRAFDLQARARSGTPAFGSRRADQAEFDWYFTNPGFTRLAGLTSSVSLAAGIESRSPFMDERVVRFMARGDRSERFAGSEVKRLLRDAMQPLLPPHALARRPHKTGTLATRLRRSFMEVIPEIRGILEASRLSELGLLDRQVLLASFERSIQKGCSLARASDYLQVAQTEVWLRRYESDPAADCDAVSAITTAEGPNRVAGLLRDAV